MTKMSKAERDIWVSIDKVLMQLERINHKIDGLHWEVEYIKEAILDKEGPTPELLKEYQEYEEACCKVDEIPYSLKGYLEYKNTEHVQYIYKKE